MKRTKHTGLFRWTICSLLFLAACSYNPEKAASFKTIFDHYRSRDNIMALSLPPGLLSLVLPEDDSQMYELKQLMTDISAFRMLSVQDPVNDTALLEELRLHVTQFTTNNGFADLFRIQSGDGDIFIRILEKNNAVKEVVMMVGTEEGFFVIDLRGNIAMDHFTKLVEGGYLAELTNLADFDL